MKSNPKKVVEKSTDLGMHLLQPYLCMALVGLLSILLWVIADNGYRTQICLALGAITLLISTFTWNLSQYRKDVGRYLALTSSFAIGTWVIVAVIYKPWHPTVALCWLLGGLTLGIMWNIRNFIRTGGRDDAMAIFFKDIGLEGTRMRVTSKTADKIKSTISLKPGSGTVEALQKNKSRIASLFKAPATGVRILPDSDNSAKAYMTVVRKDMLKEVRNYEWVPRETRTPNDPMTIGVYEDGEPAQFALHSKELGAAHMLIQGMNGSGKSAGAKVMFAEAFKCPEVEIWTIDVTKGSQTLGVVESAIDWVITEERIADMLFKKFPILVKARANHLGKQRMDKWQPECGLSFIYLHIEEASGLIADNPAFIKMMETARSVGIQITASLQRASHVAVDTAARAQFSAVLCFGVQQLTDATFALPDDVVEAGASPEIWRNAKPGYCYLVHPTVDSEQWVVPLRTFKISDEELEKAAAERLPNELDPVTLNALGKLYKAVLDEDPTNDEEEDLQMFTREEKFEVEELESIYDVELKFDVPEPMSVEDARAIFDDRLEDLRASGTKEFSAPEVQDVAVLTGRSRAWVYKELLRYVEEGILEKDFATYTFVPKIKPKE